MSYNERNELLRTAAEKHGTTVGAILGRSRFRKDVEARRDCALFLRSRNLSLPEIGRILGRHHTSIFHLIGLRVSRLPRYKCGVEGAA
jgi:chromosomal replication initiation ATPase DnaA